MRKYRLTMLKRYFLTLAIATSLIIAPLPSRAASMFDFVVSDQDMADMSSMNKETLRRFLLERGTLGRTNFEDTDHVVKPGYEIIYRVAVENHINPKFLLVLLQREQSLVEDPSPTQKQYDWALGYGVCDSCAMNDPAIAPYKGFANQLQNAAHRLKDFVNLGIGYQPGNQLVIDGIPVTPQNHATAALYSYTPHLHGNNNFRDIWRRYFLMRYPDGTLLQARGEQGVYLIEYGRKRPFASKVALTSRFDIKNILQVSPSDLANYEQGPTIAFPNYSLLHAPDDATYLLVDDTIRPITPEAFRAIGYSTDELVDIDSTDLATYKIGEPLNPDHPTIGDELIQTPKGGIYAIRDGVKYPIVATEILKDRYAGQIARPATQEELDSLPTGDPLLFRNGTLIKARGTSTVYLISNGVRRAFISARAFTAYGFEFRDVITTSKSALELHPLGNPITQPITPTKLTVK
jgi:hypothetical protein